MERSVLQNGEPDPARKHALRSLRSTQEPTIQSVTKALRLFVDGTRTRLRSLHWVRISYGNGPAELSVALACGKRLPRVEGHRA